MKEIERVLLSKRAIARRIRRLARELDAYYAGKRPLCVCVLKGSVVFFADLLREMKTPVEMDFLGVSSYGSGTKSGSLTMTKELSCTVDGREVLLVEDIIDSGNTLYRLKQMLEGRGARVKIVTLLDKPSRREAEVVADWTGFVIADEFVVGYGLDYAERYRELPYIGVLSSTVYP